ncbi:transcription factor TFIIF complex alpha subunit Tfg1 [Decorospora gaudefroyi]|uniref:Transcription factor TFIIF complex alpha subunit Tfg1 n=1 Tax=Decorospora gaudefroyi TaxID=184978 RepID=A0A6A5KK53_9PLEO|nr:transcription factor TFIIF complex alpha subunit Tfg1 [Decorospora gaudefroyi]
MNGNRDATPPVAPAAAPAPAAPNGQQHQQPVRRRRPRPQADVLRKPRRPLQNITRPMVSLTQMNEARKPVEGPGNQGTLPKDALRNEFLSQGASVFPLVVSRKDLKELRHHVMRLQSKARVDVTDSRQFATPIKLHRRDPRAPPSGVGSHYEEEDTKEDLEEIKEREKIEQMKEDRRKLREENQAKIAPTGTKKPPAFHKKTEQKYRPDDTPEAKKRQLLRYEETLPWHLEDYENKQTWVGTYESEMSETHVMLSATRPGDPSTAIQMAPMERWYRFNVKGKVKTTDDLDKIMAKTEGDGPRFFKDIEERKKLRVKAEDDARAWSGVRTRVGGGADDEGRIKRERNYDDIGGPVKREADADDIDFNLDEDFADDEEGLNGLFEGEEQDVKEAAEKLKRDQLQAALWDRPDESELSRKEEQERKDQEQVKAIEKAMRKQLVKREKQYDYLDSDPENPYITESESDTDSEAERQQAKEEAEKKAAEQNGKAPEGGNVPSGTSTKGSNTPSGNHKPGDPKSKKRPGSPNLSEASGNESSRKKHKKKHDRLADGSRKSSLANLKGAGSGSDSEMTDAGKVKKLKKKDKNRLTLGGSPSGTPGASRAGSPAANGSRAGSPSAAPPRPPLPSAKEIYESLPPQGMNIQNLIVKFKGRVDKTNTQLFIKLVKAVSSFDKGKSWLTPLEKMPSDEHISAFMSAGNAPKPA